MDSLAVGFRAVLADLEFAFDAGDGDAEAYDAGKHGAAESVGELAPLFGVGWFVGLDEAGEKITVKDAHAKRKKDGENSLWLIVTSTHQR